MENGLTWNNFNIFAIFINNNGMCLDNFIMLPKSLLFSVKLKAFLCNRKSHSIAFCYFLSISIEIGNSAVGMHHEWDCFVEII